MEFKSRRNHFLVSIISLLFFFSCSESGRDTPIEVIDAYLKKPLEGALSTAAYMSLKNSSDNKIKIKGLFMFPIFSTTGTRSAQMRLRL